MALSMHPRNVSILGFARLRSCAIRNPSDIPGKEQETMLFIRKSLLTLTALAGALSLGIVSHADIVATTGAVVDNGNDGPAFSAVPQGPGQNNEIIYAWSEQQGVVLGAALNPEVLGP